MFTPVRRAVKWSAAAPWILRQRELRAWSRAGRPVPPPDPIKHRILRHYARKYRLTIFVETGTYFGNTIEAVRAHFDRVYSIELSAELHGAAVTRFRDAKSILLIQGDSSVELGKLMSEIDLPALFWLDGHFSAGVTARGDSDTPILRELEHIFDATPLDHVIIIDDARYFGRDPEYPSVDDIKTFVAERRPNYRVTVADDAIRITP